MLDVRGLAKRYGEVTALADVSLTARPGRLVGFLGPNGAGKTTTMRAVFGLVRPDRGTVRWNDAPIDGAKRLRFGYMPEQRGLYPRMAAAAQLRYLGRLHGMEATAADAAARSWLEELGLADRADHPVSQLSHGNQQRVQLAAALVHHPELLVLDEPFSGLDPLGVAAMSDVLRRRAAEGTAVVFSSHQLDLVEELCDDVVIVAHGRDRLAGTLDEVRAASGHRRATVRLAGGATAVPPPEAELIDVRDGLTRLRVPAGTDARWLLDALAGDREVERFSLEPPSLSEIFRDVVGASVAELESCATSDEAAEMVP
jgi:ABC-2 type transport system ATP-binding protein